MGDQHRSRHIKLTSHPGTGGARPIPIQWGAADPAARGPIIELKKPTGLVLVE